MFSRGCEFKLTEIKLKKGESVDKALRRLKKKIDREGTLKVVRTHRHFEKPSERRRRKEKAARFSAMLTARYADLKTIIQGRVRLPAPLGLPVNGGILCRAVNPSIQHSTTLP